MPTRLASPEFEAGSALIGQLIPRGLIQIVGRIFLILFYFLYICVKAGLEWCLVIGLLLLRQGPCKSKVTNEDVTTVCQQDVRWLDITMYEISRVKKIESTEHVVHNDFDVVLRKAVAVDVGEDAAEALRVIVHY